MGSTHIWGQVWYSLQISGLDLFGLWVPCFLWVFCFVLRKLTREGYGSYAFNSENFSNEDTLPETLSGV